MIKTGGTKKKKKKKKTRRLRLIRHIVRKFEDRGVFEILVGKPSIVGLMVSMPDY